MHVITPKGVDFLQMELINLLKMAIMEGHRWLTDYELRIFFGGGVGLASIISQLFPGVCQML